MITALYHASLPVSLMWVTKIGSDAFLAAAAFNVDFDSTHHEAERGRLVLPSVRY